MIFGRYELTKTAVHTHNDSYALTSITAVSARRPFFLAGIMLGGLTAAFVIAFQDLMFDHEKLAFAILGLGSVLGGFWLGQLQLISRDLRGSDLSTAIWGGYKHLNGLRRQTANAIYGHHNIFERGI